MISIITPSFNMLPYLELCTASIADQEGVDVEHIVVDGASTDGTVQWLENHSELVSISEKDNILYAMVIDTKKCIGCMDCVVACKTENEVPS